MKLFHVISIGLIVVSTLSYSAYAGWNKTSQSSRSSRFLPKLFRQKPKPEPQVPVTNDAKSQSPAAAQSSKVVELREKLFRQYKSSLKPAETYELLKQFAELDDHKEPGLELETLVEAGNITKDKCSWKTFSKMEVALKFYSANTTASQIYLRHCASEQYKLCEDEFLNDLKQAVNSLDFSDKRILTQVADALINQEIILKEGYSEITGRGKLILQAPEIAPRLTKHEKLSLDKLHIHSRDDLLKSAIDGRPMSTSKYDMITEICERVTKVAQRAATVYMDNRVLPPSIVDHFDNFVFEWVPRIAFCRLVYNINDYYVLLHKYKFA